MTAPKPSLVSSTMSKVTSKMIAKTYGTPCATAPTQKLLTDAASHSFNKLFVLTTKQLKQFCDEADFWEYNQRPLTNKLQKSGKHLIYCIIPEHTNFEGKVSVRCCLMMKHSLNPVPQHGLIDINLYSWWQFVKDNHPLGLEHQHITS